MPDGTKLAEFAAWCHKNITGDEKGQAQIFLDRLFQAFGQPGSLDVGGTPEFRIRKSDEDRGGTAFADYVWKPVVLIEMKKRGENLQKHYRQAFDYWTRLVPDRPRYVVLCNFDEFRVYDFDTDLDTPKDTLALADLPGRWGPLAFLAPGSPKPTFENDREKVTREAADRLAECFRTLLKRGEPRELAQRFILQMLVALFAEDIDLLPKYFVTQILEECKTPADGFDLIGGLFEAMNTNPPKSGGRFKGVSYFNGGLFREPARVEINETELHLDMFQASALPRLLAIPKERVLKDWEKNAAKENEELGRDSGEHQNRLDTWWALKRPRNDLQQALKKLSRYVACSAVMKRPTFVFIAATYLPTNALKVFAFADDYSFGIMQSSAHWLWFITKCSKLTERFRYTPESVFDTFPWPQFDEVGRVTPCAPSDIRGNAAAFECDVQSFAL